MKNKLGIMSHFLAENFKQQQNSDLSAKRWNEIVDGFNVDLLAEQLEYIGVDYFIITIGQNSGFFIAPNSRYDQLVGILPSKCSRRDLVADIGRALRAKGIRLIVYLPSGAPERDSTAVTSLKWKKGADRNIEFQRHWESVIREWATRWGDLVAAWWFDGCYWPNAMYRDCNAPNFQSFAEVARSGNADASVAFNAGVIPRLISVTPYEDFTAGEINDPFVMNLGSGNSGVVDGAQIHILTYSGENWGKGVPRYSKDDMLKISSTVFEAGGAITWDVPMKISGALDQSHVNILRTVRQNIRLSQVK